MIFNPFATSNLTSINHCMGQLFTYNVGKQIHRLWIPATPFIVHTPNVESSTLHAVTIYSLPSWCTRTSEEAHARGSHSRVLTVRIYTPGYAKEVAQSCAVCHRFHVNFVTRYSLFYRFPPTLSDRLVKRSSASREIDENYLSIVHPDRSSNYLAV